MELKLKMRLKIGENEKDLFGAVFFYSYNRYFPARWNEY